MARPDFTVPLNLIKKPLLDLEDWVDQYQTVHLDTDYASLSAAVSAIGSAQSKLIITRPNFVVGTTCSVPATLLIEFGADGFLNLTSGQTATILSPTNLWPNRQLFIDFGGSVKFAAGVTVNPVWWPDLTATVPAPTNAPTLSVGGTGVSAGLVNGTSYKVAYTYRAWNGETGISPASAAFTAVTNQGVAALAIASLADNSKWAVQAHFYMSNDGGTTWHRTDTVTDPNFPGAGAFCESEPFGGTVLLWNASGAAPPGGAATTTTKTSRTVSPPANAPTVTQLANIAATTYYGAFSFLCGDGTESALSAISAGQAVTAGQWINFRINNEPPSGAVAIRRYLGTVASAGSMHLQDTVPLFHVNGMIHTYNSGGAAPSAGSAHSVVGGFQRAWDAIIESGGGAILVTTSMNFQCPLILRLKNQAGTTVTGTRVQGVASDQLNNASSGRLVYTGTQTGIVGILACGSAITWSGLDTRDVNNRIKYGWVGCDFYGAGGFESIWHRSYFEANFAGGIGGHISILGASPSSHICSEQFFDNVIFSGKAWGFDPRGGQTGDLIFRNCSFNTQGDSNSANSGNLRLGAGFNTHFEGMTSLGGGGEYRIACVGDYPHPLYGRFTGIIEGCLNDASSAGVAFLFYSSPNNSGAAYQMELIGNSFQSNDGDTLAVYSYAALQLTLAGNKGPGRLAWINFTATSSFSASSNPFITAVGGDNFLSQTLGDVKINDSVHIDYTRKGLTLYTSSLALHNESGQKSLIGTNAGGDIAVSPARSVVVNASTPVIVSTNTDSNINGPRDIYIDGHLAYISCATANSLRIHDISNPLSLANGISALTDATNLSSAYKLWVAGGYAFVCCSGAGRLTAVDVRNPTVPAIASSLADGTNFSTGISGIQVVGKYAYVVSEVGNRITIVDISNPGAMVVKGSLQDATNLNGAFVIHVLGKYAYVGCFDGNRLTVVNISNPASPTVVGSVQDATNINNPRRVYVSGKYVYIAAVNRVTVVDVSNPASPFVVGSALDSTNLSGCVDLDVVDHYAIATSITVGRVTIVDVANPASPVVVSSLLDATNLSGVVPIRIAGRYAFVAGTSKLNAVDIGGAIQTLALTTGGVAANHIHVAEELDVAGSGYFGTGLNVGVGGINSQGPLYAPNVVDYAEGTFTPGLSFGGGTTGITYSLQQGSYKKIGNMVQVWIRITLTSKGTSTGQAAITGLPFTVATPANTISGLIYHNNITYNGTILAGPGSGGTTASLWQVVSATGAAALNDTGFTNTTDFIVSFAYPI